MKALFFFVLIAIASLCMAQTEHVLIVHVGDPHQTISDTYDRIVIEANAVLEIDPGVTIIVEDENLHTATQGLVIMNEGSTIKIHNGAELDVYHHSVGYYGNIEVETGTGAVNIYNGGVLRADMINSLGQNCLFDCLDNHSGLTNIGYIEIGANKSLEISGGLAINVNKYRDELHTALFASQVILDNGAYLKIHQLSEVNVTRWDNAQNDGEEGSLHAADGPVTVQCSGTLSAFILYTSGSNITFDKIQSTLEPIGSCVFGKAHVATGNGRIDVKINVHFNKPIDLANQDFGIEHSDITVYSGATLYVEPQVDGQGNPGWFDFTHGTTTVYANANLTINHAHFINPGLIHVYGTLTCNSQSQILTQTLINIGDDSIVPHVPGSASINNSSILDNFKIASLGTCTLNSSSLTVNNAQDYLNGTISGTGSSLTLDGDVAGHINLISSTLTIPGNTHAINASGYVSLTSSSSMIFGGSIYGTITADASTLTISGNGNILNVGGVLSATNSASISFSGNSNVINGDILASASQLHFTGSGNSICGNVTATNNAMIDGYANIALGGGVYCSSHSTLEIIGDVAGNVSLSQATYNIKSLTRLLHGSKLSLNGSSLVNVRYTSPSLSGTLNLYSGCIIEGSTAASQNNLGDRIIVDAGAWMGTFEANPSEAPVIRQCSGNSQRWPGITIYASNTVVSDYTFTKCNISGIDAFSFKGNGTSSRQLIIHGCMFENMGKLYLTNKALCTATFVNPNNPLAGEETRFAGVINGVIVEGGSKFVSDGCIYTNCSNGAITGYKSTLHIGGTYDPATQTYSNLRSNTFTGNGGLAVISCYYRPETQDRNVIYGNSIGQFGLSNSASGINVETTRTRIKDNEVRYNKGHGFIGKENEMQGVITNNFMNNVGTEYFSDSPGMDALRGGFNFFTDDGISPYGRPLPPPPFYYGVYNLDDCDTYLLIKSNIDRNPPVSDVSQNLFNYQFEPLAQDRERFYPWFSNYIFGRDVDQLYENAKQQFDLGNYAEAKSGFQYMLNQEPESPNASSAINYLFNIAADSDRDYASLRSFLGTVTLPDSSQAKVTSSNCIINCFIAEHNYEEAIGRLQLVLDNPSCSLDSLYAAINQGYCYMKLMEGGARFDLSNCSVKTKNIDELQQFTASLFNSSNIYNDSPDAGITLGLSNYPNPFRTLTSIQYNLPKDSNVKVNVYNIKGEIVKNLINRGQFKGANSITWDGTDNDGKKVPSGVYFCHVNSDNSTATHKVVFIR